MEIAIIVGIGIVAIINGIALYQVVKLRKTASVSMELIAKVDSMEKKQERLEGIIREEFTSNRKEMNANDRLAREELHAAVGMLGDSLLNRLVGIANLQNNQLDAFSVQLNTLIANNEAKLDKIRETLEVKLQSLQEDNSKKLEQMRETVDEKLHSTLEKRLGESFKVVSERLEKVHQGLGEMQNLATGVGDLKKVLTNVKNRGILGEIQLENILEQLLSQEQYEKNVSTKANSGERVEFAIKLPGGTEENKKIVWLPIDSKFPLEDYQRLLTAYDQGHPPGVEEMAKQLEVTIKLCAKTIRDKYIDPPHTTDFGVMFLPIEGLYAEVLRRPGLFETLQRDYKVTIAGPSTLAAFLNSLQMGFRTLAIQQRSSEVWSLLSAVKAEFGKFGTILEKTHKKLQEASNTIDSASRKSRTIERKLRNVGELPSAEPATLLGEIEANVLMEEMEDNDD